MAKFTDMTNRRVFVDGIDKGSVYKSHGCWHWQRGVGSVSIEPFSKNATLHDVKEWARKCCNGTSASIHIVHNT